MLLGAGHVIVEFAWPTVIGTDAVAIVYFP
jgi:hypothetical protein